MHYFKRKLLYPAKRNKHETGTLDKLRQSYMQHLFSIKLKLPEGAWKLAYLSFHDARVLSVAQPTRRELVITLDGVYWGCGFDFIRDKMLGGRFTTLSFSDLKKAWVPQTIIGDDWLYEEMHLSDVAAFDYQALLWKDEIRIQADEVDVRSYD